MHENFLKSDPTAEDTGIKSCCAAIPAAVQDAKERITDAGRQALVTVRKYPVESVALAIGVGALVWWMVSRLQKDEK